MKDLDEAGIQAKVHALGDGTVLAKMDGLIAAIDERGTFVEQNSFIFSWDV